MDASSHAAERSDEELMCAYRDGEAAAFDRLYAKHADSLYRFVLRNAGAEHRAGELFQDIWMRVINSRARYVPAASFRTWLFAIAHNRLTDHYRAQARQNARIDPAGSDLAEFADPGPLPGEVLHNAQLQQALLREIEALPHAQREAFLLKQEADLSLEQIAEVVGTSRETVKSRLRYAMAKLRTVLRERL